MQTNYPYFHPLYIGQMLKPPHPIARAAYMMALWINPNNHALDGGRASSAMEQDAVAQIARMIGFERHVGHLCSGGTVANLEALWVAGCLHPGKSIVASGQAHYTHQRISSVLRLPFLTVDYDQQGRMDINALADLLARNEIGTVVVTAGTTATGAVDPLVEVLRLQEEYGFRVHVDAAYGGYFTLVDELKPETRTVFDHFSVVDSLVVDPHKHGLQPYGCGCVLFRDPSVGRFYKHDSPYTYFTSDELHLGEISLECSRAGASAVALWATLKLLPLTRTGEFRGGLTACRQAATKLHEYVVRDPRFFSPFEPELDIVVWAVKAPQASSSSDWAQRIFDEAANEGVHLALANLPRSLFQNGCPEMDWDRETLTAFRACVMKPEHLDWIDRIWERFDRAASRVLPH
jgi:glutamate/tyrosine decarboxylase-like PLP-dependent enzyme